MGSSSGAPEAWAFHMPRPRFHHPLRAGDSLLEALTLLLRTRRSEICSSSLPQLSVIHAALACDMFPNWFWADSW